MTQAGVRRTVALAALLLWPVLLLLDTGVALARGWKPAGPAVRLVAYACAAALLATLVLILLPAGRRLLERRWAALVTCAVSLSLAWTAVEALALAVPGLLGNRFAHSRGPGVQRLFHPDPRWLPGIQGESRYTTNDLGVRGGPFPPAGTTRVLCLGGSTTECTYLDDRETWTHLLMDEVSARSGRPVWAGGLGISGATTFEHLDFLRRAALARRFDDVVLLVGINDLVRHLNGSLEMGPRPLWRRSALWSAIAAALQQRTLRHLLYEQEDPAGANILGRRRLRREAPRRGELPDLEPALHDYGDRIAALAGACRRRGMRCLFLTQPVLWRADLGAREEGLLWMGADGQGSFFTAGALRQGMDRYNATLLAACARLELECFDLAAALDGRPEVFYDDCHFTEAGAREVARRVAAWYLGRTDGGIG